MSKEALQAVIGRAVSDDEFRKAFFANPDKALTGYDLTEDEVAALKDIDAESMEALSGGLDERISKAWIIGWTIGAGGRWTKYSPRKAIRRKRIGGPLP